MTVLPVTSDTSKQNILLASGFINLGELGNVSAAFYDGQTWIPYLVTSEARNGDSTTALSSLFFLDQPYIATVIKSKSSPLPPFFFLISSYFFFSIEYLATPLVILVAIAISLVIVFLIVLGAMIVIFVKRKRDAKVNPQSSPSAYYGKPPRTPQSLLAMLKDTSDDKNSDTDEDDDIDIKGHSMDKSRHLLEPGTQQFYNLSKSISTDHLHEQSLTPFNGGAVAMTTARAAPSPPTAQSRSISSTQNAFHTMPHAPAPAALTGSALAGAMAAARPESYARPISEYQRDSEAYYNNPNYATANYSREMAEVPGRQSPYNPFRNSEIGVAIDGGPNTSAAAGLTGAFYNASNKNVTPIAYNNTSYQPTGEAASYTGSSPLGAAGATMAGAGMAGAGMAAGAFANSNNRNMSPNNNNVTGYGNSNPTQQAGEAISYNNVHAANHSANAAIGAGAAIIAGTRGMKSNNTSPYQQDGSTTAYNNTPPKAPAHLTVGSPAAVRWTNAPSEQVGRAVIEPISMVGHSDESSLVDPISGPQATRAMNNASILQDMRWNNSSNSSRDGLTTPIIAVHGSDNNHQNSNSPLFMKNRTANNNLPASNVQWTHQNANSALGVAKIEPDTRDSAYHDHGSFYSPVPLNLGSTSNHSLLTTDINATTEGFSSDPDIVRWTTAPTPNTSTIKIEPIEENRSTSSLGNSRYQPALSTHDFSQEYDDEEENQDNSLQLPQDRHTEMTFNDDVNTKVIHKNAFRLSDAGSLAPIDTSVFAKNVPIGPTSPEELLSPDSGVRWKTANVGSPIETAYAPKILTPAIATVTRRSANEEDNDAFEDYYSPKPASTTTQSMFKPVANTKKNIATTEEPVGRKSESADDAIAKRDLNALSMIIQNETEEPSNPFYNTTPIPTNTRKEINSMTPAAAQGAGAMDGRASSKRMVEEYFSSRNPKVTEDPKDKKPKYKSDFKSVMAIAIQNNTKFPVATEENPHLYYAKFDFTSREHGELGFEKASPIIVVDSSDDIWWMGYKADSKLKKI